MKIYKIKDNYIDYLRKAEPKVLENKSEKRPYLGVVLKVNDFDYFVPLSSPKPKHIKMHNAKDFHKIAGGQYGAINFNKIIPISSDALINFSIQDEQDEHYRVLLQNQQRVLGTMENTIRKKAQDIYNLFSTEDDKLTPADLRVKQRCCDFNLLEKLCSQYSK